MNTSISQDKSFRIQILRALAILLVVIIHTTPMGLFQVFTKPITNVGVALFLFLSGYLTKSEINNPLQFYKKRIIRVLVPYILWVIISTMYYHPTHIAKKIIYNLITAKAGPHFYFIQVYIQLILITPLLKFIVNSKLKKAVLLITPVSMIIFVYLPLFLNITLSKSIAIIWGNSFLAWFSYYYLGFLFGNEIYKINIKTNKIVLLYSLSLILQLLEGYIWYRMGNEKCGTQVKLSVFFTASTFLLLTIPFIEKKSPIINNPLTRFLKTIGDCSFGIYLIHICIIEIIRTNIPLYSNIPFFINSIIILLITLVVVIIARLILRPKLGRFVGVY